MKHAGKPGNFLILIPVLGSIIFATLYFIATLLYPGGSQANKISPGFSWANNYWCNLLNKNAINGQSNPARPVALTAMLVLCFAIAFFWFLFPITTNVRKPYKRVIQLSGATSMAITMFLFTDLHDMVINIASLFGLIALIGTFAVLYNIRLLRLFWLGMVNILLIAFNNYFYYSSELIFFLPVIQKISFAFFLVWLCCICVVLYLNKVAESKSI